MEADQIKRIKRVSDQQEKRTAKDFGGRGRPGSGNKDGMKGDMITGRAQVGFNMDDFLVENKFTFSSSFSLKLQIWDKIANEALRENMRTPVMQVDIAKGTPMEVRLIIMLESDFKAIVGLPEQFPIEHRNGGTHASSYVLSADVFHSWIQETSNFRASLRFSVPSKKLRANFTILHLEDFKNAIAKC